MQAPPPANHPKAGRIGDSPNAKRRLYSGRADTENCLRDTAPKLTHTPPPLPYVAGLLIAFAIVIACPR